MKVELVKLGNVPFTLDGDIALNIW